MRVIYRETFVVLSSSGSFYHRTTETAGGLWSNCISGDNSFSFRIELVRHQTPVATSRREKEKREREREREREKESERWG